MKIYFKHPNGWEFRMNRKPREPMEPEKFYVLMALAAGALLVVLFLGSIALK